MSFCKFSGDSGIKGDAGPIGPRGVAGKLNSNSLVIDEQS